MKRGVPTVIRRGGLSFAAVMLVCVWCAPARCGASDVVLLLEQTPVKGGDITPVAGVYHFAPGAEVTLSALPKPGYQFVHWLGDVSDPTATDTVVCLNKPKVVVAVFEQIEHGLSADPVGFPMAGGGAPGGLFPTAVDLSKSGGFSGGGVSPKAQKIVYTIGKNPSPEVPEPATSALLIVGGLFAFARRKPGRVNRNNSRTSPA